MVVTFDPRKRIYVSACGLTWVNLEDLWSYCEQLNYKSISSHGNKIIYRK
jgi:hypothetical protein